MATVNGTASIGTPSGTVVDVYLKTLGSNSPAVLIASTTTDGSRNYSFSASANNSNQNYEIKIKTSFIQNLSIVVPSGAGPFIVSNIVGTGTQSSSTGPALKPEQFGAVGDGIADDTSALQRAIDGLTDYSTLTLTPGKNYRVGQLTISNKTNVKISGWNSKITYKAMATQLGMAISGTCTSITIEGITFVGSGNSVDRHYGILAPNGSVLKRIRILYNTILNCSLGISFNANLSGSFQDILVEGNMLDNVVGTASGYGYGIHRAQAGAVSDGFKIIGNTIRGAQRHSIYHAMGTGSTISGNTILDHRATVGDGSLLTAIQIARSADVTVTGNTCSGGKDGCITIGGIGTGDGGTIGRNITVSGNVFTNPLDTTPMVIIGQQSPVTEQFCEGFVFSNNVVYSALTTTLMQIYTGKRGRIEGNLFEAAAVSGTTTAIRFVGQGESAGTALYTDDLVVESNTFNMATGGTKIPLNLAGIETTACKISFKLNTMTIPGNAFAVITPLTNPNISIISQRNTGIMFASGTTALDTLARPEWTAKDHNLLAWTYDGALGVGGSAVVAGTLNFAKVHLPVPGTVTNVILNVVTVGATLTSGNCIAGVYTAAGAKIAVTADQSAAWVSTGNKVMALTGGGQQLAAGDYYVVFWFNGTTSPQMLRTGVTNATNVGLTAPNFRNGIANTGLTDAASAPLNLGTQTADIKGWWAALS